MLKYPWSFVVVSYLSCVPTLTARTVAPGRTPLLVSDTVPTSAVCVANCAAALVTTLTTRHIDKSTRRIITRPSCSVALPAERRAVLQGRGTGDVAAATPRRRGGTPP